MTNQTINATQLNPSTKPFHPSTHLEHIMEDVLATPVCQTSSYDISHKFAFIL